MGEDDTRSAVEEQKQLTVSRVKMCRHVWLIVVVEVKEDKACVRTLERSQYQLGRNQHHGRPAEYSPGNAANANAPSLLRQILEDSPSSSDLESMMGQCG